MAALAAIASKPALMLNTVLTDSKNSAGIHGVKFYIRGKPWVVTVDEELLTTKNGVTDRLVFAQPDTGNLAIWGPIYEKAWSKVKGNYDLADGGFFETGIRGLTGFPVMSYYMSAMTTIAIVNNKW
jgi:hypothetical protein